MTIANPQDEFRTTDLALAAYLVAEGSTFLRMEDIAPKKYEFVLFESPKLHERVRDFSGGEGRIEPLRYYHAIRNLRGMIAQRRFEEEHDD